ncbi:MAG: M67 family metallopeptidase [bacterium]
MITLKRTDLGTIIRHSQTEYPYEACGILAGKDGVVSRIYPMTNTDGSPTTFFMNPEEQLRVFKQMRKMGIEMLGIYHSHPASSAYPSKRDCDLAYYEEASYLIISLANRDRPEVRSFKIKQRKIKKEKLKILEG